MGNTEVRLYNRIAVLRAERSLSRQSVADAIGVNYQTIGYIERGDYSPSLDLAFKLSELFGVPVEMKTTQRVVRAGTTTSPTDGLTQSFDLLELPRPPAFAPWAYVKVAEGCDRRCGFCAIPSFRGKQRSRPATSILAEIEAEEQSETAAELAVDNVPAAKGDEADGA